MFVMIQPTEKQKGYCGTRRIGPRNCLIDTTEAVDDFELTRDKPV